jgi:hypothetical protein
VSGPMFDPNLREWSDDGWRPGSEKWTEPGLAFWRAQGELFGFMNLSGFLAVQADSMRAAARDALDRAAPGGLRITGPHDGRVWARGEHVGYTQSLARFNRLRGEVVVSRGYDNYLSYVTEIMALLYQRKPELLKPTDNVQVEWVMEHESMEDLMASLAERRVALLARKGLGPLSDHLSKAMGLDLFESDASREAAILAAERRHLIVHHRAIINRRWMRRFGSEHGGLGERLELDLAAIRAGNMALHASVRNVELMVQPKFGLLRYHSYAHIRAPLGMLPEHG